MIYTIHNTYADNPSFYATTPDHPLPKLFDSKQVVRINQAGDTGLIIGTLIHPITPRRWHRFYLLCNPSTMKSSHFKRLGGLCFRSEYHLQKYNSHDIPVYPLTHDV